MEEWLRFLKALVNMGPNELKYGSRNKICSHHFQQREKKMACCFQLYWFLAPHRRERKNIAEILFQAIKRAQSGSHDTQKLLGKGAKLQIRLLQKMNRLLVR